MWHASDVDQDRGSYFSPPDILGLKRDKIIYFTNCSAVYTVHSFLFKYCQFKYFGRIKMKRLGFVEEINQETRYPDDFYTSLI